MININDDINLPLEWRIPDTVATYHTTNYVVQKEDHEFVISFFETRPPIILGSPEDVLTAVEKLTTVPAICVVRVSIAIDRLPEFIKVLEESIK